MLGILDTFPLCHPLGTALHVAYNIGMYYCYYFLTLDNNARVHGSPIPLNSTRPSMEGDYCTITNTHTHTYLRISNK